jgi:hypothetical protein
MELNGTHQLLVVVVVVDDDDDDDDDDALGENMHTIKKNPEALLEASREVGLEVNTKKTKYMFMSHHQNAGQLTPFTDY